MASWGSSCFSAQSRQWMAFLDESFLEELTKPQPILVMSTEQQLQQQQQQHQQQQQYEEQQAVPCFRRESSSGVSSERKSRKRRHRDETCSKAVREKIRRDKLNDKFLELSVALEPGRPPKTDKASILIEAACAVKHLREEAQQLKESNEKLRDAVKDLKVEKNDLRDEKLRLKAEKERLEEQLKSFSVPYMPYPALQVAALAGQNHQLPTKIEAFSATSAFPSVAMWQWMPSTSTDTSQDHLLRPPVA